MTKSLCVIMLAAGNSSRFGTNKLLYSINNQPMYQYTLNLIEKLKPTQIILISKYPEITKKIDPNIIIVKNFDTHLGQSHSMQLALKTSLQQSQPIDGYMFIVCDQPYLKFSSLKKLYNTWQVKDKICALAYQQKRGNPVIFPKRYLPNLLKIQGDTGGRAVISQHLEDLYLVEVTSAQELIDIDTLDTLTKLKL